METFGSGLQIGMDVPIRTVVRGVIRVLPVFLVWYVVVTGTSTRTNSCRRTQRPSLEYRDNRFGFRLRKLIVEDVNGDGVNSLDDCDDTDITMPNEDGDCDGVITEDDCDDSESTIHPYAGDIYGDGIDSDCDGLDCEAGSNRFCGLSR